MMGCCCSQEDDDVPVAEPTETTRLLTNAPINPAESRAVVAQQPSSRPTGSETLAQILDRSANAYIDVNAVDNRQIRTYSYSSKFNQYSERLNSTRSFQSSVKNPYSLPFGVASHNAVLNEPIISKAELDAVVTTAEALSAELNNMKPRIKEPLATYMP